MKKVLLSAVLSIVLCLSLVTGATMALFTSESKVNIAVSSGKVEVVATLEGLEYKTLTKTDWQTATGSTVTFDGIGGEAVLTDSALTLTNIVPGDAVKVAVKIVNNSTVATGYKIQAIVTGTNASELQTSITTASGTALPVGWQMLIAGEDVEDLAVTVELPSTATIQNVTADVEIVVSAMQANAVGGATLNNVKYDTFAAAAAVAVDGDTIQLGCDTYTLPAALQGKKVTVKGYGNDTVINMSTAFNADGATLTFENLYIEGVNSNTGNGYGIQHTTQKITYKNCTINNSFTNEFNGTVEYNGCTFTGTYYVWTYSVKEAAFINCTFDKTDSRAILVYSHGNNPVNVTVADCTFKAAAKGYTGVPAWTAAVEVDTTKISSAGTTVTITDSTADANYNGIVRDKSSATATPALIKVDGVVVGKVNAKNLATALNNAAKGETITISEGNYGATAIDGTLEDVTIQAEAGAAIEDVRFNIGSTAVIKNVTFKNITVTNHVENSSAYVDGGIFNVDAGAQVENLVIEGGSYKGSGGRSALIGCSEPTANIKVSGATIEGTKYLVYASAPNDSIVIENCTIKNISSWLVMLNAEDTQGLNLTITGCEFINCTGGIAKTLGSTCPADATFVFTNNTLDAACEGHDGSDAKWFAIPAAASQITVSGNKLGGADWTPGTAQGLGK